MNKMLKGILALIIGLIGAIFFVLLDMSLAWVLGSMTICAILSLAGVPLSIPNRWRSYALTIIGTILGSSFNSMTIKALPSWFNTIGVMLLLTFFFFFVSYKVLIRYSGMNKINSFLSAVPGGLSIISGIADLYKADTRRIALSHAARLVALLSLTPIILYYVGNYQFPENTLPQITIPTDFNWFQFLILISCAVIGYYLAKIISFPMGFILFPIILSAIVHSFGLVTIQMPSPIAALAQTVIGTTVGIRFTGYRFKDIINDGWISILLGIFLALGAAITAYVTSLITNIEFPALLLVFLPGGAPELGVMAVALNINPAMITTHHMLRVVAIVFSLGFLEKLFINNKP